MKIGLLHNSILPPKTYGGIERMVMILAREYTRLGHQVVILCKGIRKKEEDGSPVEEASLYEMRTLPENYKQAGVLNSLIQDLDFLHAHEPIAEKPKIPHLITNHGNGHPGEKYLPNTNFLSKSHAKNHHAKYFIFNGVDPERYPFVEKKEDYFVFLARTTWRVKNVKTAIAWAQDLKVRLEIMGGNGVSRGNIHYNGLVNESEKIKLLSKARALIYPTNWDEPCAQAPLEALACGTPVITSVNGCMPELVSEKIGEETGVVCSSYQELLQAAEKVKKIQPKDCRKSVEEFFSLKRMASEYLKMFEKIILEGELDHQPKYNFDPSSVHFLFKPTWFNQLRIKVTGKI